jgi:hypothetical protein
MAADELSFDQVMALRPRVHQDIASSRERGTVFTKTHNMFGQLEGVPLHNVSVMAGAVYVVRNPLDVVLSVADHFGLSVDEAIDFMANESTGTPTNAENVAGYMGSWSTHVASWTMQTIHRSSSSVMKTWDNSNKAFGSVARLLGLDEDRNRVRKRFSFLRSGTQKQELAGGFVRRVPTPGIFPQRHQEPVGESLSDDQVGRIVERHRSR